jgi:hypothetical protein
MRYYSDLLPSYLDGENIQKHSGVIERSDRYLDGLVELFSLWNKLERPILIKREQTGSTGVNDVTIYVNTPTPITEIIIEGDIEETITPTDTVTTSYTNTGTINNPSIEIYTPPAPSAMRVRMPEITATVHTETHTYTKTYPENDTIENNNADHDIFLDIIGGILGIPRRQYTEVTIPPNLMGNFGCTTPPYMAKEVQTINSNALILPCSEDDYYYKERLDYFINTTDNLRLFRTVYDKDVVLLQKEDEVIPSELVGTDSTVLFTHIQKGIITMSSLNIDTTNIQEIAEQTLPITRPVQIYPYATIIKYNSTTQEQYVNKYKLHLVLGLNAKTIDQGSATMEVPIANLPVKIKYSDGTEVGTFITDETGTAHINIDGARGGQQTLKWDLTREYPYFNVIDIRQISYNASLFKLSLSDDAWQYKIANGTAVTDFEDPTILTNNHLDCGRGYMVYTPAINPSLVDLTDYNIHVVFHYTTSAQRLLLGTLTIREDDTANIIGLNITPRSYESADQPITATHTLDFKFTDGVCSVYYDGTSTGVSRNFNGTEKMLYIAGSNRRASGSTQGLHIEEILVGDVPTPTPVATSLSVTTLASTTGSASIKATLTANGSGVSGATIECSNGTTLITSNTTDNNGECTLDLSTLQAGSYTLTIEYDGDTTYQGSSITHSIIITSPQEWTIADVSTTSTEWSTTPQSDGVHTTNNYVAYQTKIPSGNTIPILPPGFKKL